jgi:hypothetical protein
MEAVAATATPSDGVYDFALRVVRDGAVAADVVRQTFAQAGGLDNDHGALYALARTCAPCGPERFRRCEARAFARGSPKP